MVNTHKIYYYLLCDLEEVDVFDDDFVLVVDALEAVVDSVGNWNIELYAPFRPGKTSHTEYYVKGSEKVH